MRASGKILEDRGEGRRDLYSHIMHPIRMEVFRREDVIELGIL